MEIGWAVDKGLELLKVSHKIYKAFQDPDSNAPRQFRDLSRDFAAFHVVFKDLLEVVEKYGKPLLVSPTSIQYTLDKCRLFQEKFGVLNEVTTKKTPKQVIAFTFRTLQWSLLAENLANDLRTELATHTRILSLCTDTLNLRNTLEERVENHEIREQNREILRLLKEQQASTKEADQLHLPSVPHHQPHPLQHLDLPEVPRHEPQIIRNGSRNQLAEVDAARRNLEALEHLLMTESRAIAEIQTPTTGNSPTRSATNFINLARHEIELQSQRVINYQKRMQGVPSRSSTSSSESTIRMQRHDSNISESGSTTEPDPLLRRQSTRLKNLSRTDTSGSAGISATGLQISLPISETSLGASLRPQGQSMQKGSADLPDDSSIILRRYLARYENELSELDQYDVDGQIAQTREELFELVHKSFPPSPELHLSPFSTSPFSPAPSNRVSPSIEGTSSATSPSIASLGASPKRRDTFATMTSRRGSIDGSSWRYLAKNVQIDEIPYTCAQCSTVENTALQVARRPSGGLSFRLLCIGPIHKPADGLLFRHDLSSSTPAYPHVFHNAAHKGTEDCVRIIGSPSKLEACKAGTKFALQVQALNGPMYRFASLDDSEAFQQLVRGARLIKRIDIRSASSSALTGHPTRYLALRIWSSLVSETLSLSFFASLLDKHEPFPYIERSTSFSTPSVSGDRIKLRMSEHMKSPRPGHKRTNSKDSSLSGVSNESDDIRVAGTVSPSALIKIKWIELEFHSRTDRDEFARLWKEDSSATT